jgi:phage gpG-like protein
MSDTKFGFGKVKANIQRMKVDLPIVLANDAQNYFVKSWSTQSWDGVGWAEVKRREGPGTAYGGDKGTPEWRYPKGRGLGRRTRAILVQTGALRRATSNSIRSKTFGLIRLVVDLPYAAVHNYGLPTKNGQPMPARPFMKDSPILKAQQKVKIKEFTDKVWRK